MLSDHLSNFCRSSDGTVEAIECLQAMVSGLYTEVFSAVIYLINRLVCYTSLAC